MAIKKTKVVEKRAIKKKVTNRPAKKRVARRSSGYIVIYIRKNGFGYYAANKTSIVICENEKELRKSLSKFSVELVSKKRIKVSRTIPKQWTTPTGALIIIKGKVLSAKVNAKINIELPKDQSIKEA